MNKKEPQLKIRNQEIRLVRISDIEDAPWNFREHPQSQSEALGGALDEIGFYGYPDVYVTTDGKLRLTDGHLRKELLIAKYGADTEIEVNVTDFDEAEAKKATLTKDPLAAMAEHNQEKLASLIKEAGIQDEALKAMLDDAAEVEQKRVAKELEIRQEFSVLVHCDDEPQQKVILEELNRHGLDTKALIVDFPKIERAEPKAGPALKDGEIEIVRSSEIERTARVMQLEGLFDVPPNKRREEKWRLNISLDKPWNIGLIVGASGSGKTTVARELFGQSIISQWPWNNARSVVDNFPEKMGITEITSILSSVGFSSPPSWLKPFSALSNGEQFRVMLARTLAENPELAVVDEFTSVVDRTIARIGSAALAKAIRGTGRQFIAVACHYDIEEWLQPDWKIEMPSGKLTWRLLRQRPEIDLHIRRASVSEWETFRRHHYLDHNLHKGSQCFIAEVEGIPAAFTGVLHSPHANGGYWREHRTVCHPDFQGVGIGNAMSEYVASLFVCKGKQYRSVTTHPAMIRHRMRSKNWRCDNMNSIGSNKISGSAAAATHEKKAVYRMTASFQYIGPRREEDAIKLGVIKQDR